MLCATLTTTFARVIVLLGILSGRAFAGPEPAGEERAHAVPTFACVGLYWRTPLGGANQPCRVYYRPAERTNWSEAMPLWFDAADHSGAPEHSREYRGSIVGLEPATTYEIRLVLNGLDHERRLTVRTWDERFKIARTVTLPERIDGAYVIRDGGSATEGYVLYTSPAGVRTLIDGRGEAEINLRVEASHVIVRGLDLRGARRHGIDLGAVDHVVVEDCDISGWGENLDDGWGRNFDSAIHHATPDGAPRVLRRLVIQNNRLHHPRSNANSWMQPRESRGGSRHPVGPQAISLINADGEIVIRHNDIYSDFEHMFNDAMGEYHNFGYAGFPGRDSDIYGNRVSHCWDDGIEIEGANLNVRCWANVIDWTFDAIGCATTSLGPCYVYRNLYLHSRKGPGSDAESYRGQCFLKLGADLKNAHLARGRIYVFHNTVLQPPAWGGFGATSGAARGLHLTGPTKHQTNIVSRNNVLWLRDATGTAVHDGQRSPENDFDHDLSNGVAEARPGSEVAGLRATPQFSAPIDLRRAWTVTLATAAPGRDQAVAIPNFNDEYAGAGPDMGALEAGRSVPGDFPAASTRIEETTTVHGVTVRIDVAYLEARRAERLDLYLPPGWTPASRRPAVLWIHGGGWTGGSKAAARERNVCHTLAAAGIVCASVNYRLGDGAWPQNLEDCKNGVRYLRSHAAELGIDPDRIGVAGGSAGGHLALMAALTADDRDLEPAESGLYQGVSSAVRCVIDFYGPANLLKRRESRGVFAVFGAESLESEVLRVASPVARVTAKSPPVLILHGNADVTVPPDQSLELARVLEKHGVPHELVLLDGVGHTFDLESWNYRPLPRDVRPIVADFLARYLGPR